jgi:hypothetical protein
MANTKISALSAATTPLAGTEVLPIVQGGATTKVSVANLTAGRTVNAASLTATGDSWIGAASTSVTAKLYVTQTVADGYTMAVNGLNNSGTRYLVLWQADGTNVGAVTSNGTTTTYATSSDYRLKENIQPMTGALEKVSALKPVTYNWKSNSSNSQGFIAHELQAVVPECVVGEKDAVDADGKPVYQGIDTSFLVATLTAAIQEQQAIIASLKARLDAANL